MNKEALAACERRLPMISTGGGRIDPFRSFVVAHRRLSALHHSCIPLMLLICGSALLHAEGVAKRAADYDEALTYAQKNKKDIVVYQRGSDWNHLGERIYRNLWNRDELLAALGEGYVAVSVDSQENLGGTPVSPESPEDAAVNYKPIAPPNQYLLDHTDSQLPIPKCQIQSVASEEQVPYHGQADGSFLAGEKNPGGDAITISLSPEQDGNLLRMDFLLHESLPGKGPGRADGGDFAISELEVRDADSALVPAKAVWANAQHASWGAWQTIDGITNQGDNAWHARGHQHQQRTLLVVLDRPLKKGFSATVKMICRAQWGQHVPGCLSAAIISDAETEARIISYHNNEMLRVRNSKFTWRGRNVPRIALMDCEGRPVASHDKPRDELTIPALVGKIQEFQKKRSQRDEFWASAEKAEGPAKAELLLKGLKVLGDSVLFDATYKPIQEKIKLADPNDTAGCNRCLQFDGDPRSIPPMVTEALKLSGEKKYDEAIALLDKEITNPLNHLLTKEQIQRIMVGKFHVYLQWEGNQDKRFDVQKEIHAFEPTTFLGLGAIGYLAMHHKTEEPVALCYGWAANHVKSGEQTWRFELDTPKYFDHAGRYAIRILHNGGKDPLKIKKISFVLNSEVLSSVSPDETLAPGGKVEAELDLKKWVEGQRLTVKLEAEAEKGKTEVAGRFEIDQLLN